MLRLRDGMRIEIAALENAGCNNGNYPEYRVVDKDGATVHSGITCRCGRGCSGTDCIRDDWGYRDTAIEQYRMTPEEEAAAETEEAARFDFTPSRTRMTGIFKKEELIMKKYKVRYDGGISRDGDYAVDYMEVKIPLDLTDNVEEAEWENGITYVDEDDNFVLYAEVEAEDEDETYPQLKEAILSMAEELEINAETFEFPWD